jgi:hypothetical protein
MRILSLVARSMVIPAGVLTLFAAWYAGHSLAYGRTAPLIAFLAAVAVAVVVALPILASRARTTR